MSRAAARPGRLFRAAVTGLVTSGALVVATGVVILMLGVEEWVAERLLPPVITLALFFAVATVAATVIRRGRLVLPMALAIVAAAAGAALLQYLLFTDFEPPSREREVLSAVTGAALMAAMALIHTGVFTLIRTHSRLLLAIKVAAMGCAWSVFAVMTAYMFLEPFIRSWVIEMIFGVTTTVLILVAIVSSVVVPVAAHVGRERAEVETIGGRIRVELACPRCEARQTLPTGTLRCARCRGWLKVNVEEPRCECGYQLYKLRGERCPECGRDIPPEQRWSSAPLRGPVSAG